MAELKTAVVLRTRAGFALAALLTLGVFTRAVGLGQPIVENYVGRQVPTAMVARNLERGSGFLAPQLDVAPLPNLFLVEPPLFAALAVGLKALTRLPLEGAGRLVSALGIALGAWGLFGLSARREGTSTALVAVAVFLFFPVTIRYGRAFQPDALMLGCVVAGMRCWDDHEVDEGVGRLGAAWVLLATGLALKVVSAYMLIPLVLVVIRDRKPWKIVLAALTLLPAALWYAHAASVLWAGGGSKASADNGAVWLRVLLPSAWLRGETYVNVARYLGVRAFTPLGTWLAVAGFVGWRKPEDRLWRAWAGAALATLCALAAKLHHEYYWLAVAPVGAVGVAKAWDGIAAQGVRGKLAAGVTAIGFFGLSAALAASTWRTPAEWLSLRAAAREVRARVPADEWVVAPEALLFEADRRGCRLELTPAAARRAAGEWNGSLGAGGPAELVEFYRLRKARFFADVRPDPIEPERRALHAAVKRRYNVLVDRPGVLIAKLDDSRKKETPPMATLPPDPPEPRRAVTIPDFARWKEQKRRISVLTAYDFTTARLLDAAGVDCLLVGDSLGMAVQGRETTLHVTLDQMVYHAEMVARGASRAIVIADMPFGSYEATPARAVDSGIRFLKETRCQGVKLEGGRRAAAAIGALVGAGVPVMGHVGLTPQSVHMLGGFRVQRDAGFLVDEALAVAEAGAFAVVLECLPSEVAEQITATLAIPTIGIGAGPGCDGQVLVTPDLLGLLEEFRPRFVRRYADLASVIRDAAARYVGDVAEGRFPNQDESFR